MVQIEVFEVTIRYRRGFWFSLSKDSALNQEAIADSVIPFAKVLQLTNFFERE